MSREHSLSLKSRAVMSFQVEDSQPIPAANITADCYATEGLAAYALLQHLSKVSSLTFGELWTLRSIPTRTPTCHADGACMTIAIMSTMLSDSHHSANSCHRKETGEQVLRRSGRWNDLLHYMLMHTHVDEHTHNRDPFKLPA